MNNIVRVDRNTVHNYLNFDVHGEESGNIIKCLLLYFSKAHQYDLFGYGTLDRSKFAKEMGLSDSRLKGKCENPFQFNGLTLEEIETLYSYQEEDPEMYRVYDSNIENALYILLKSNMIYPDNYMSKSSLKSKISSLKSTQVLTNLQTQLKTQRGGKKVYYYYELSKEFKDNLSTFFLNLNVADTIKLRRSNNDGLYMFISNELQMMKADFLEMKEQCFDDLCHLAKIDQTRPRDNKEKLIRVFKKIQKETSLSDEYWNFEFIKKEKDSKWEYKVMFINKVFFKDKSAKAKAYDEKFKKILEENISRECLEVYISLYGKDENIKSKFKNWMKDGKESNKEEKMLAYKNAYFRTKGSLPVYIDNEINSWFKELKIENL